MKDERYLDHDLEIEINGEKNFIEVKTTPSDSKDLVEFSSKELSLLFT